MPEAVLDDFAGTGWGVAAQKLGLTEYGVEIMAEAVATRTANGMKTIARDVWTSLLSPSTVPHHEIYLASPPCQTFSRAGKGEGRQALNLVLAAIDRDLWKNPHRLRELGDATDERTALVLAPLARIYQHRPKMIALEQVAAVLPVWEAYAPVLAKLGYQVWTGLLHAEQYGVPQVRTRAVLLARRDGVTPYPPEPTHSRFHGRDQTRLDIGVAPWVTMAEALGWPEEEVIGFPRTADKQEATPDGYRARDLRTAVLPAATVTSKVGQWGRYRPATAVVGDARLAGPGRSEFTKDGLSRQDRPGMIKLTPAEAAALQSYPEDFTWVGTKTNQFKQIGNAVPPLLAEAILRTFL